MSLWDLLERAAADEPAGGLPAALELDASGRGVAASASYAELRERAARLAQFLARQGLEPGMRVAIVDDNRADFLTAYFAAAGLGAVLCPLNARLRSADWAQILAHAEAHWLLAGAAHAPAVRVLAEQADLAGVVWLAPERPAGAGAREIALPEALGAAQGVFRPAAVRPEDPAQLYYTSGTTGAPKGVALTAANVGIHAATAVRELEICAQDVWGHVAPMFHLADAWATFALTAAGGRHVFLPRFEARALLGAIEVGRITLTNLIPTMLQRLLDLPELAAADCSSLRLVLTGGAPIAPAVVRRALERLGCEYAQTYGMTETSPYLTLGLLPAHLRALPFDEQLRWRAKTGRPFAAVELRVVDGAGRDVPPDGRTVGEIRARGPTVTPGYWNDPAATARAFDGDWLCTGDLATLDAEGFLDIVDRKQDMILSGGENVYSSEVENALYAHPAVLEAAVYGVPHADWGEAVEAAIVLRGGASAGAEELAAHCRTALAAYKVPKRIVFLDELPRLGSGKLAKRLLRARAAGGS